MRVGQGIAPATGMARNPVNVGRAQRFGQKMGFRRGGEQAVLGQPFVFGLVESGDRILIVGKQDEGLIRAVRFRNGQAQKRRLQFECIAASRWNTLGGDQWFAIFIKKQYRSQAALAELAGITENQRIAGKAIADPCGERANRQMNDPGRFFLPSFGHGLSDVLQLADFFQQGGGGFLMDEGDRMDGAPPAPDFAAANDLFYRPVAAFDQNFRLAVEDAL